MKRSEKRKGNNRFPNLSLRFKFNQNITEEEEDRVWFAVFDLIFASDMTQGKDSKIIKLD